MLTQSSYFLPDLIVVDGKTSFCEALKIFRPAVILSDYRLPEFTGLEALKISVNRAPTSPFIFVTGAIGEDLAAETVLNGAWGFVLKSHLVRLNKVIYECLLRSDNQDFKPSLDRTTARVKRQIQANNEMLLKARSFINNSMDALSSDLLEEEDDLIETKPANKRADSQEDKK